ncbi:MAG: hypothetical protein R3B45_17705 [Bdellovibrionota bacterium]
MESYIENGYAPSEIAILLANERLHGNLVRSFIAQRQINANMAISLNMRQSTSGSWIKSLSNLSSTQESAEAILSFATHPMSVNWLNRNIPKETPELAHERSQFDKLATILSDNICRQTATSGLSAISKNCEQIEAQHALNLLHDICKTFLHNNKQRYPLKDWASELRTLADEFNIFDNPPFLEDPGLKASISTGWKNFIADIEETRIQ